MPKTLTFSHGSMLVLGATICWGLENNCTRQIANRDPMEIVTIKGFGPLGALVYIEGYLRHQNNLFW